VDLVHNMCIDHDLAVDMDAYNKAFDEFREASKKKATDLTTDLTLGAPETAYLEEKSVLATNDLIKYDWNAAQESGEVITAKVLAIYEGDAAADGKTKRFLDEATSEHKDIGLVFDKTPVYAEAGGQIADTATVKKEGMEFNMLSAKAYKGYVVHMGRVDYGTVKVGDEVTVAVDFTRRSYVSKNHTATHILNFALRKVLGQHVNQASSSLKPDSFTFDYTHDKGLTLEQMKQVENICNDIITVNYNIHVQEAPKKAAFDIDGLRAMFTAKYGEEVRVVSIGQEVGPMILDPKKQPWGFDYSVELCGGTHVASTKQIYKFVILDETAVSQGTRRIVACTSADAAANAVLDAVKLTQSVDGLKGLRGKLLDKEIGALRDSIGREHDISKIYKEDMLAKMDSLKEAQLKIAKENSKRLIGLAKEEAEKVEPAGAEGAQYIVHAFKSDLEGDGKAFNEAANILKKKFKTVPTILISFSAENGSLQVKSDAAGGGKSAKEWAGAVLHTADPDAKFGGSDKSAQGQIGAGVDAAKMSACVHAATAFIAG